MRARLGLLLLVVVLLAPLGPGARPARAGPQCEARAAVGVRIVVVAGTKQVARYAATLKGRRLRGDAHTVVFADGRVVTARLGEVGDHLTALGWSQRPIEILASFPRRAARRAPG